MSNKNPLVLFLDTFITADIGDKGGYYKSVRVAKEVATVRDKYPIYKWQKKIDVVKYTLSSYAEITWDKVVIRFECEDIEETDKFKTYCTKLFPSAKIETIRSATAMQYQEALKSLNLDNDSWIFFSPNNDHPYLANPDKLKKYISIIEKIKNKYPNNNISFLYSHYTESLLDNRMSDPQWGYHSYKFKQILFENEDIFVIKSNLAPLDSIQIFQLGYLLEIFSTTKNKGRVVRLEDTEFCSSQNHSLIQICPKIELCRHYDGYTHLMNFVPPLFIPPGFFENNIRIRYGFNDRVEGWVNINPSSSFLTSTTDLPILLEDIPFFWKKRISEININKNFYINNDRKKLIFYKNFINPWHKRLILFNLLRSFFIYYILRFYPRLRHKLREITIILGIFGPLKAIKKMTRKLLINVGLMLE